VVRRLPAIWGKELTHQITTAATYLGQLLTKSVSIHRMVKRLNVPLDDSDYERVSEVKNELGLTWEEFLIEAANCLEASSKEDK